MNQKDERELYELIRNLSRGLKKHGLKKVIASLKQINLSDDDITDTIEEAVCSKLGVPRDEIYGFASRGEITIARKFCILLTRKFVPSISPEVVGSHYNRSRQIVHNAEKEFKLLKIGKKNKFHIDFIALYQELEREIQDKLNKLHK